MMSFWKFRQRFEEALYDKWFDSDQDIEFEEYLLQEYEDLSDNYVDMKAD